VATVVAGTTGVVAQAYRPAVTSRLTPPIVAAGTFTGSE
jgi:hypothetical protein